MIAVGAGPPPHEKRENQGLTETARNGHSAFSMKSKLPYIVAAACTLGVARNHAALAQNGWTNSDSWTSNFGGDASAGYDIWHGFPDGTYPDNNGVHAEANFAYLLLPQQGIGVQAGGSYGVYDFNGRDSSIVQGNQEQTFLTGGFFYRGPENSPVNAGIVYDTMINHNFGVAATDATLQQLRGQIGVKVMGQSEIGLWGAMELNRASIIPNNVGVSSYRGIDQASVFYHYTFDQGADARIWAGVPISRTLQTSHNNVGTWLVGGRVDVPLNDRISVYGEGAYMSPHTSSLNFLGVKVNEVSSISIGISFNLGAGKPNGRSAPYLPVANNSTFFVDGDNTF